MTVERSQEAVEAAVVAHERAFAEVSGRGWTPDDTTTWMRAALAAADAVDPCVPVRVLREWIGRHTDLALHMYRDTKLGAAEQGAVLGVLSAFAALLDEHANERTDT